MITEMSTSMSDTSFSSIEYQQAKDFSANSFNEECSNILFQTQSSSESLTQLENLKINKIENYLLNEKKLLRGRPASLQIKSIKVSMLQSTQNKIVNPNNVEFNSFCESQSMILSPVNRILEKYEFLEKIEEGGHGTVWRVQNIFTKQVYAAKKIIADNEEMKKIIEKEFNILQKLNNEFIIKPIELIYDEEKLCYVIIQEFFEGKSFYNLLKHKKLNLSKIEIEQICEKLLQTIKYMHEKNIIHKDLTLMNVLYNQATQQIKLIDFGIAQEISLKNKDDDEYSNDFLISPISNKMFWPVDILANSECNEKIDEFGLGLITLSLLENKIITYSKLKKLIKHLDNAKNQNNLYKLAINLVHSDSIQRFSAEQSLQYLKKL